MGPPRVKPPRPPSRSRFHEGSMNDRASAVPPVQFLGAEERAALERPAAMSFEAQAQAQAQEQHQPYHHYTYQPPQPQQPQPQPQLQQQQDAPPQRLLNKRSTRLLGQMWDGVWGRLGFRRDNVSEEQSRQANKKPTSVQDVEDAAAKEDRPSREEILANYHQLVASGFFSAHAIQSTRRPGPGSDNNNTNYLPQPSRTAPSAPSSRPSSSYQPPQPTPTISLISQPAPVPPTWPLTPNSHRHATAATAASTIAVPMTQPSSPLCAPNSAASSRGTKRAADSDNDDEEMQQLTPRKLRKSASRDMAPLPRLRNAGSRRNILSRRSFSTAGTNTDSSSAPVVPAPPPPQQRETIKLTKRVLARLPGQRTLDMPIRRSSARRNVSECQQQQRMQAAAPLTNVSTRLLRSRKSATEPMRVVPDANRGIPHVPTIPEKFTHGEDRENGGPRRGLRW